MPLVMAEFTTKWVESIFSKTTLASGFCGFLVFVGLLSGGCVKKNILATDELDKSKYVNRGLLIY